MPLSRRVFAVLAALLLSASFAAGCSSKKSEPLPEASELIGQSITATKALKSAHLEIAVNGKIAGLPVKTLSGDLTNVPSVAIQGSATISMGGSDVDVEMVVLDGTLYAALEDGDGVDRGVDSGLRGRGVPASADHIVPQLAD